MSDSPADAASLLAALDGTTSVPIAVGIVARGFEDYSVSHARRSDRFEFGSVTKTMTAQVLASLAVKGTLSLGDQVGRWLDAGPNGSITLEDLARHRSGLPRMPANAEAGDRFNELDPFASYTAELAQAALREVTPDPDREPLYSNFGYQVLGLALERASGTTLEALVEEHVFVPFGLASAAFGPHPDLVQGSCDGKPTPAWRILLAGPGGVVGTIADLLAWGAAVADPPSGPHGEALRLAIDCRSDRVPVGLGWQLHDGLTWHNGGTYGFHACLAIDRSIGRVAASLVATSDLGHVDEATMLAAKGNDPLAARPEPTDDRHHAPALAVAAALVSNDWPGVHAAMSDPCRAALTIDRLSSAWDQVMGGRGRHVATFVRTAVRKGPRTEVGLHLSFQQGEGWAKVTFDEEAQVVGLLIG